MPEYRIQAMEVLGAPFSTGTACASGEAYSLNFLMNVSRSHEPIPVAGSGVMLVDREIPSGNGNSNPPAKSMPSTGVPCFIVVWHSAQAANLTRYRPVATSSDALGRGCGWAGRGI